MNVNGSSLTNGNNSYLSYDIHQVIELQKSKQSVKVEDERNIACVP
jgi:hypothetical protein